MDVLVLGDANSFECASQTSQLTDSSVFRVPRQCQYALRTGQRRDNRRTDILAAGRFDENCQTRKIDTERVDDIPHERDGAGRVGNP